MADKNRPPGLKLSMMTDPSGSSARGHSETPGHTSSSERLHDVDPYHSPRASQTGDYHEIAEETGITGFRIVARIVDYMAVSMTAYIFIIPAQIFLFFTSFRDFFNEPATEPGEVPDGFFATLFLIWGAAFVTMFLVSTLYFWLLEHKFQRTAGKKAFGLLVTDLSGKKATGRQLLARATMYTVGTIFYFWIAELIVMLVREDGRSLTDMACNTKVLRVRRIYRYVPAT